MSLIHNYNFKWYHYRDNFLSHEECDTIIKKIDNAEQIWSNSKLEKNVQLDEPELVEKYWGLFNLVNTLHYQFDITGVQRQTKHIGMGLAEHAAALCADGQKPVHMRRIPRQPIGKPSLGFALPWFWISRIKN